MTAAKRDALDVFRLYAARSVGLYFVVNQRLQPSASLASSSLSSSAAAAAAVALLTPGGADLFTKVGPVGVPYVSQGEGRSTCMNSGRREGSLYIRVVIC